jgi:PAS domain S-box-containing protein
MLTNVRAMCQALFRERSLAAPFLVGLLASVALVMFYSAMRFHSQLEATRVAASDSRVWSVSQLEVDHANLLYRLARLQEAGLTSTMVETRREDVRLAFDIFLSRLAVVTVLLQHKTPPTVAISVLGSLNASTDAVTLQFDAMDWQDPGQVLGFFEKISDQSPAVREIALNALGYFIDDAQNGRRQEAVLWTRVLVTTAVLLVMMAAAAGLAFHLRRQMREQLQALHRATDNIRMVYESSMMAVVVTDRAGDILLFNGAAERLFGCIEKDMLGRNVAQTMIPQRLLAGHLKAMDHYAKTGLGVMTSGGAMKTVAQRSNGTEVPVEISICASRDIEGHDTLIAFIRDVSEQEAHEANLREARDEARHHAAAKSMFLATMSHEMRTPLHGLLASLDLIDETSLDNTVRELITTARECGKRSLQQINDVLQITQMTEMREQLSLIDPAKVVGKIVEELRALAADQGNLLQVNLVGADFDRPWIGKPTAFTRVMYNLIGNAIKFTRDGHVTVTLKLTVDDAQSAVMYVEVADTGIGISTEDAARVFDPFFSSANSGQDARDHTGLGLSIARIGVEKMGGRLELVSKLGTGSRFFFDIPFVMSPHEQNSIAQIVALPLPMAANLSCLVVDDSAVNLKLTAQMLRRMGCLVSEAQSGEVAVALARDKAFDMVFMDLNMPNGLSGTQATRLIRAAGLSHGTFVIALTADVTFQGDAMLEASQMDDVLHKPFAQSDLAKFILSFTEHTASKNVVEQLHALPIELLADFQEMIELIGPSHSARMLLEVGEDIDLALQAVSYPNLNTRDYLHRAISSTAAIGLLVLSDVLRQAEDFVRENDQENFKNIYPNIFSEASKAKARIKESYSALITETSGISD